LLQGGQPKRRKEAPDPGFCEAALGEIGEVGKANHTLYKKKRIFWKPGEAAEKLEEWKTTENRQEK